MRRAGDPGKRADSCLHGWLHIVAFSIRFFPLLEGNPVLGEGQPGRGPSLLSTVGTHTAAS